MRIESNEVVRKEYRPPRLVDYGDVRRITAGPGGTLSDGSSPGTRPAKS